MAAPTASDAFAFCPSPGARNASEVRFISTAKGKGLFATRKIQKGETIFVEKPVVASQFLWNAMYKYRACDHCLRALETAEENAQRLLGRFQILPRPEQCSIRKDLHQHCPSCQVTYCSAECRKAAWEQYHQVLCLGPSRQDPNHPLNKLQEAWRNIHYPPETSSIMLMARMVATIKQGEESFANDRRVEFESLHNKNNFREVRQYRTNHHLVRFYFITRVFSNYMESSRVDAP
nr:histone-lysine N-trimethyltransferase SMYD5-like [Anolis sagrei ordinatus]